MTALPPEERPPGSPEPVEPAHGAGAFPGRAEAGPNDEILGLLAGVVVFEASVEDLDSRRPPRSQLRQHRQWRHERDVLERERQVLKLRVEALPHSAYLPFPRPCL